MGNADTTNRPLSLPREEWGVLAQKTRTDYLGSLNAAIEAYEKQTAPN